MPEPEEVPSPMDLITMVAETQLNPQSPLTADVNYTRETKEKGQACAQTTTLMTNINPDTLHHPKQVKHHEPICNTSQQTL